MNTDDPLPSLSEKKFNFLEGEVLLIDKPLDWTSFDVVNKIRYRLRKALGIKKIKVGHAGTLDPMATGLLIICTGKATKTIDTYQGQEKTYTGSICFGGTTASYDRETEVDQNYPFEHINDELIQKTIEENFMGKIEQIPPMFSAIKVDGQPLYKKARKGEVVEVKPRTVEIFEFLNKGLELPEMNFKIKCSKGTYIRSIANDIGKEMNSGGYLTSLRRTKIGDFHVDDAYDVNEFCDWLETNFTPEQ
jgi:tRNA pseudouridine55 synthase